MELRILTYFDALITNIIVKIGASLNLMMKTIKKPIKSWFFPFIFVNNGNFEKKFQIKVVDLIEEHILCCINFYRTGDSFPEKDRQSLEVITGWRQFRIL